MEIKALENDCKLSAGHKWSLPLMTLAIIHSCPLVSEVRVNLTAQYLYSILHVLEILKIDFVLNVYVF